jgi:RNA polymerase sigma factor (sigma-70 family)
MKNPEPPPASERCRTSEPKIDPDFRVHLAREADRAVEREAHFMRTTPDVIVRAKESLTLYLLTHFRTRQDLNRVQAWFPYLLQAARRTLRREEAKKNGLPIVAGTTILEAEALAPSEENPQHEVMERHEYCHLMAKIELGMRTLSPRERQVLEERRRGMSYEAIARILGITRDAVYVHSSAALRKLRDIFRAPA